MSNVKDFLKRKDIVITPQRYLIEALGAMAQGLFASLLIGTSFSVRVVLPASGWLMIANVRRRSISSRFVIKVSFS